ncbi:MAG: glycosyltransferase [Desulfobacterales bacterium]|nr:glycosyltransferase [Desulfobacterales bacterium]
MDIIKKMALSLRYCMSSNYRQYRYIRKLQIFDSDYFQALEENNTNEKGDVLWEYIKKSKEYCHDYVINNNQWVQLADPHPLFDTAFYLSSYFPQGIKQNPFFHYLKKGWKRGLWPSPFFDPKIYQQRSGWSPENGDPLTHYTQLGAPNGLVPGLFFEINWYLDKTPVLYKAKKIIIRHYKLFGSRVGKSPVPVFDPEFYLSQLNDDIDARSDPFSHFVTHAEKRGIQPNKWFDLDYYRLHMSRKATRAEAFSNYLSTGVFNQDYINHFVDQMTGKPVISVIVPVYEPNTSFLNNCIRSVVYQAYPHWELCLADDDSPNQEVKQVLLSWARKDPRIKVTFHDENMGISAATNSAASLAKGDYLGFLDNDDELSPDCLLRIAQAINDTSSQVIYTDEDLIGDDGTRLSVFYKPDFNRDLLFSHNYVTHFLVVATKLFKKLGGFSSDYDGAQDYDLMLKLSEQTENIAHLPHILYHWRASDSSTSINHRQKSYAHQAGKRALENSLNRRNLSVSVEDTDLKFYYRIKFPNRGEPSVSVIQWLEKGSKDHDSQLSLLKDKTQYDNSHFMSVSADQHRDKANLLHNAVLETETDYIAFIGSNIIDVDSLWLTELLAPLLQNSQIGIVCGNFHYSNTDGASYTVPDLANRDCQYFANFLALSSIHANGFHCTQLIHYSNWDFCLLSRSLFNQLGGFDFNLFPHILAMADFSMRAVEQGKEILYTPYAQATARGCNNTFPIVDGKELKAEKKRFQKKWKQQLDAFAPYYNRGILDENDIDRGAFRQWILGK